MLPKPPAPESASRAISPKKPITSLLLGDVDRFHEPSGERDVVERVGALEDRVMGVVGLLSLLVELEEALGDRN